MFQFNIQYISLGDVLLPTCNQHNKKNKKTGFLKKKNQMEVKSLNTHAKFDKNP